MKGATAHPVSRGCSPSVGLSGTNASRVRLRTSQERFEQIQVPLKRPPHVSHPPQSLGSM